jgi:flagellar biosynthetic protein FliR
MTLDLGPLLDLWTYQFMLVFARVGAAAVLLPGIGDLRVPARVRLLFALALSVLTLGAVGGSLPAAAPELGALVWQIVGEVAVGLFIGATAAALLAILHMAGNVIAAQIGLGNALTGELFSAEQGASIGAALTAAGLVIIFATGLDHMMLSAIAQSYDGLPVGRLAAVEDLAQGFAATLSSAFAVAIQLSTPFLVLGLAFNVGLALANRALPQLPVFFVGLPASLVGGIVVLMVAAPAILFAFAEAFEALFTGAMP